ncbi:hypothetical protein V1523DRAFT_411723 [Lipomyces doorenjongii]
MDVQNTYYNGWVHAHFTSNIFVFSSNLAQLCMHSLTLLAVSMYDADVSSELFSEAHS